MIEYIFIYFSFSFFIFHLSFLFFIFYFFPFIFFLLFFSFLFFLLLSLEFKCISPTLQPENVLRKSYLTRLSPCQVTYNPSAQPLTRYRRLWYLRGTSRLCNWQNSTVLTDWRGWHRESTLYQCVIVLAQCKSDRTLGKGVWRFGEM